MIETRSTTDFLGRGWTFPPTFSRHLPGVEMLEKEPDIHSSLEVLLSTSPGERVMLPEYGCNMEDLLFASLDTTTKTLMADRIKTAILLFEPRIDVERISMNSEQELEGVVLIEIEYIVRSTNTRSNFVFPFYKQEGTDLMLAQ